MKTTNTLRYRTSDSYADDDFTWLEELLGNPADFSLKIAKRRAELIRDKTSMLPSYLLVEVENPIFGTLRSKSDLKLNPDQFLERLRTIEDEGLKLETQRQLKRDSRRIYLRYTARIGGITLLFLAALGALVSFLIWYHDKTGDWTWDMDNSYFPKLW